MLNFWETIIIAFLSGSIGGAALDYYLNKKVRNESLIRLKKTAMSLLEADAKRVFINFLAYKAVFEHLRILDKSNLNDVEKIPQIKATFEFFYFDLLKENPEFLAICIEPPFNRILDKIVRLKRINCQIQLAMSGDKSAKLFAFHFINNALQKNNHRELLKEFKNETAIDKIEAEYVGKAELQEHSE